MKIPTKPPPSRRVLDAPRISWQILRPFADANWLLGLAIQEAFGLGISCGLHGGTMGEPWGNHVGTMGFQIVAVSSFQNAG